MKWNNVFVFSDRKNKTTVPMLCKVILFPGLKMGGKSCYLAVSND